MTPFNALSLSLYAAISASEIFDTGIFDIGTKRVFAESLYSACRFVIACVSSSNC